MSTPWRVDLKAAASRARMDMVSRVQGNGSCVGGGESESAVVSQVGGYLCVFVRMYKMDGGVGARLTPKSCQLPPLQATRRSPTATSCRHSSINPTQLMPPSRSSPPQSKTTSPGQPPKRVGDLSLLRAALLTPTFRFDPTPV